MSLSVPTRNARLTCVTRRSYLFMNHTQLLASSVTARCRRFIQFLISNLRVKDFIQPINKYERTMRKAEKRHAVLTCGYTNEFDTAGTLWARALQGLRASRLRLACSVALVIGISLCLPMGSASSGSIDAINPKIYIRLSMDHKQANCLLTLYGKESAFNPYAIGNLKGKYHVYGIPQIKNPIIYSKSPIEQVRYGIKYIHHRYNGDTCMALHHWKVWGWH